MTVTRACLQIIYPAFPTTLQVLALPHLGSISDEVYTRFAEVGEPT